MAKGINKVIIVGHCGQDPETKYLPSGDAVTTISVATSETWTDKQTSQKHERTEWHRIVFFNRIAEIAGEYLRKGTQIYVEGRLQTRKWQDQSGQDRYTTEIIANNLQMLGGTQTGQQQVQQTPSQHTQAVPQQQYHSRQQRPSPQNLTQQQPTVPPQNFDDDIPF